MSSILDCRLLSIDLAVASSNQELVPDNNLDFTKGSQLEIELG